MEQEFENWKIHEVVYICVNEEAQAILDSMCFPIQNSNEARDFFENLSWDNYKFKKVREMLGHPISEPYVSHVNSCLHDQFRDSYSQSFHSILNCASI